MKKLIKFLVLILVLCIFAFSNNRYITKARKFSIEKGKIGFEMLISKMKSSENETVKNIGKTIE